MNKTEIWQAALALMGCAVWGILALGFIKWLWPQDGVPDERLDKVSADVPASRDDVLDAGDILGTDGTETSKRNGDIG